MNLRSVFKKEKRFVFTAFGNKDAAVIFKRFPMEGETFSFGNLRAIHDNDELTKLNDKDAMISFITDRLIENITNSRLDYYRFFEECVDSIENLKYEGSSVITNADIKQILPYDAFVEIAKECYEYANREDTFSIEEKKKLAG